MKYYADLVLNYRSRQKRGYGKMRRSEISLSDTMRRLNPHLDAGEPANVPQRAKNRARKRHTPEHAKESVAGVRRGGEKLGEYCVSYMRKLEGANT